MKKSTGIVFIVVLALAAFAYFHDWRGKPGPEAPENPNAVNLAFKVQENDINEIRLTRAGVTMVFDRKEDGWYVTQPLEARADDTAVNNLAHSLATLPEDRSLQATPQQLTTYGLANPLLDVAFKLQNGTTHTLVMGAKDFSGLEVYSRIDGSKNVELITNTAAQASDKSLDDFRDRSIMLFPNQYDVNAVDLKNSAGDVAAKRDGSDWEIVKPIAAPADSAAIATLIDGMGTAKVSRFISDGVQNDSRSTLAQYGLANPAIRLDFSLAGGKSAQLLIGKKDGMDYYAMDTSRSMIFTLPDQVFDKLNQMKVPDMRSKVLFNGTDAEVTSLEVQNSQGTTKCVRNASGTLVVQLPPGQTGGAPDCPDFLSPLENIQSVKVEDQVPGDVNARLAKPAFVISLTETNTGLPNPEGPGQDNSSQAAPTPKNIQIKISGDSGSSVYARTSAAGPAVYEFKKGAFDSLNALRAGSPTSSTAVEPDE